MSLIIVNEDSLDVSRPASSSRWLDSFTSVVTLYSVETLRLGESGSGGGLKKVTVGTRVWSAAQIGGWGSLCVHRCRWLKSLVSSLEKPMKRDKCCAIASFAPRSHIECFQCRYSGLSLFYPTHFQLKGRRMNKSYAFSHFMVLWLFWMRSETFLFSRLDLLTPVCIQLPRVTALPKWLDCRHVSQNFSLPDSHMSAHTNIITFWILTLFLWKTCEITTRKFQG